MRTPVRCILFALLAAALLPQCATKEAEPAAPAELSEPSPQAFGPDAWRGVHLYLTGRGQLPSLHRALKEVMAPAGLNTLVLEVNYSFQYASHPELVLPNAMTKEDAQELAALCRKLNVRLIPMFQCFGHQGHRPGPLLAKYPELMAPPKPDFSDPDHYHCSWNPLHPKTNEIVFALIDELIDAFQPEAFHVGLDEVFLFPDETTPYYNGESNAEVLAKCVNDLHGHVVKNHGFTMLMWGDRLIDKAEMPYHNYESSDNDTAPAADMIPTDIIICDWHYLRWANFRSVPVLAEKGFRVWPSSWRSTGAALAFMEYAQQHGGDKVIGHLCTTWCGLSDFCRILLGEEPTSFPRTTQGAADTFRAVAEVW